jgi:hypothetical protein
VQPRSHVHTLPEQGFVAACSVMATIVTPVGELLYENAVEAAYGNGPVVAGDEMIFQRTRIRIDCPAADPPPGEGQLFYECLYVHRNHHPPRLK